MSDIEREAFEEFSKDKFPHMYLARKGDTGDYVYKTAMYAWEAWQAARQAPASGEVVEFDYEHPTYCEIIERISEATCRLLLAAGYDAETALDADEALEANIFKNIDLVAGDVEELRSGHANPPAKVPEGKAVNLCHWLYRTGFVNGEKGQGYDPENREAFRYCLEAMTTPTPATTAGAKVSTGWKLVPIEPTKEMRDAAQTKFEHGMMVTYQQMYRAMIAASPAPPQEQ